MRSPSVAVAPHNHRPRGGEQQLASMSDQRKAVIKNADMTEPMQQDAVDVASKALSEYNIEKARMAVVVSPSLLLRL